MANLNILAPWRLDNSNRTVRVKVLSLMAASPWSHYCRYPYVFGVGRKLHSIPLHNCGSERAALEQLLRAQRVIHFADATGCRPIAAAKPPKTHQAIRPLAYPDHVSYWYGPNEEPLVLVETYMSDAEVQAEIARCGLTACVLVSPGIYGGGGCKTTSVLLTSACNKAWLDPLSRIQWQTSLSDVVDTDWFTALNLAKVVTS
jgi:hypothetical protein